MAERLAAYDYRALGKILRPKLDADGRGWRVISADIGVTPSDLSRVSAGQPVAAHKVIAICDWAQLSFRAFYTPATARAEDRAMAGMFHGTGTETGANP